MTKLALPRWIGALALLGLVLACGYPDTGPDSGRRTTPPLAVWSYRDLAGSASDQAAFFEFAAHQGVGELFLGGADLLPRRAEALATFLESAQRRGIAVSLVLDMDSWARPDQRPVALEAVGAVRDFDLDQANAGRARLAALQIDVEPYALPDWERESATLSGH